MESPFDVLEIDTDADESEVRRAYRRRVIETHPDQGGSARKLQRVRAAYEAIESGEYDIGGNGGDGGGDGVCDEESGGGDGGDDSAVSEQVHTRVEYLNYEVLEDHGWELDDDDLFSRAADADLDPGDYGEFLAHPRESLLQAAESRGFSWPFACRGGACANCAVAVVSGAMATPSGHLLTPEMRERGIRLSCISAPITAELAVVYDVKHLPDLDELRLPPYRFERTRATE